MCEDPMMSCTVMHHLRPYILLLGLLFVAAVPAQPAVDEALDAQAMSRSFPEGATNGPRGMGAGTGVVGPDEPVLRLSPAHLAHLPALQRAHAQRRLHSLRTLPDLAYCRFIMTAWLN